MKFRAYIIGLHCLLVLLLVTHDNIQRLFGMGGVVSFPDKMANIHHLKSQTVVPGASVFMGDSITQRMSTSFLGSPATNYGIGWARTADLIRLIPRLQNLHQAGRIFLLIGINDFASGEIDGIDSRLETIADMLPPDIPVVWSGIQPVKGEADTNAMIADTNRHIESLCKGKARCTYVDTFSIFSGRLAYYDDHIHFSQAGYGAWQNALLEAANQTP